MSFHHLFHFFVFSFVLLLSTSITFSSFLLVFCEFLHVSSCNLHRFNCHICDFHAHIPYWITSYFVIFMILAFHFDFVLSFYICFFVSFQFFTCDFVPHIVCNFCFEFHLLAKFKEKRKKSKWNYLCHAQSSTSCKPKTPFALSFLCLVFISLFTFFILHFFYFAIYVFHFIYFYPMFDFVQEWASMLLFFYKKYSLRSRF